MSHQLNYDHNCPKCEAYYIPFNQNIVCPKCGFAGDVRFDFINEALKIINTNLENYSWIKPEDWEVECFADHVLMLIYQALEFYAYKKDEMTPVESVIVYFNKVQFKDQEYLRQHLIDITAEIVNKLQHNEAFINWIEDFQEFISNEEIQSILNEDDELISDDPEDYIFKGMELIDEQLFENAIAMFDSAIKIDSDSDFAYYGLALALRGLEKFDEAIEMLDIAIDLRADEDDYYNLRADCQLKLDRVQEAITDLNHSIQLFPENAIYFNNRGICYRKDGLIENAISDFKHSLRLDPEYHLPFFNLAVLYSSNHNWGESIFYYKKYLENNKSSDIAWYYLALDALEEENYDMALKSITNAINLNPINDNFYYERALIYREIGAYKNSLKDLDNALNIFESGVYYNSRGLVKTYLSDYHSAIDDFHKAIIIEPSLYNAYNNMIECQILLGLFKEALINIEFSLDKIKRKSNKIITLIFKMITLVFQDEDVSNIEKELHKELTSLICLNWNFSSIKEFIDNSLLNNESKDYLQQKLKYIDRFNK